MPLGQGTYDNSVIDVARRYGVDYAAADQSI